MSSKNMDASNPWADDMTEMKENPVHQKPFRPEGREQGRQHTVQSGGAKPGKNFAITRSETIYEDLANREYDCVICSANIINTSPIWSCKTCHNVYHFDCINIWASRNKWPWMCPSCKENHFVGPEARCWCGAVQHSKIAQEGNTCGSVCGKHTECGAPGVSKCCGRCKDICHPGPCALPECSAQCLLMRTKPQVVVQNPTKSLTRDEINQQAALVQSNGEETNVDIRPRRRDRTTFSHRCFPTSRWFPLLYYVAALLTIQLIVLLFGLLKHIPWITQPLKYQHFTEHNIVLEYRITVGISAVLFFLNLFTATGYMYLHEMLTLLFNIWGPRRSGQVRSFFLGVLLVALYLYCCSSALVLSHLVPPAIRFRQMEMACKGFETRADVFNRYDVWNSTLFDPENENSKYEDMELGINTFRVSPQSNHSTNNTEPFYDYYRMEGNLGVDKNMTVDFDLVHHQWRILELDHDLNSTYNQIRNGSWSNSSLSSPHVSFGELNLMAPNLEFYTKQCMYQPYMTIYRTDNMTQQQIDAQNNKAWSGKSDDNVVMRTVGLGHITADLQVCAKRRDTFVPYQTEDGKTETRTVSGLGDDVVIPLGLLLALRVQMEIEGRYVESCVWWQF